MFGNAFTESYSGSARTSARVLLGVSLPSLFLMNHGTARYG